MTCNEGKQFKHKAPECDKLDCWCFPEPYVEQKITIKNKKYCWLYPQRDSKKLNQMKPNFELCETLYTLCDYRLENYVFKQLLLMEAQIRNHAKKLTKEMRFQRKILEDMWKLSQKFLLLSQYHCCIKPYPEIVSLPAENYIRCAFQKKMKAINFSNCRLVSSLDALRTAIRKLNTVCAQMDMTVQSPFMLGDHNIRPLPYYRKLIDDTFEYFHDILCSLKSWTQLLDIGDSNTIDDFKGILDPAKKYYEVMNIGKVDCTCMRTRNTEGIIDFVNKCN